MKQDVLRQVPIINWKIASIQIYIHKKHIINYYILIIYITFPEIVYRNFCIKPPFFFKPPSLISPPFFGKQKKISPLLFLPPPPH